MRTAQSATTLPGRFGMRWLPVILVAGTLAEFVGIAVVGHWIGAAATVGLLLLMAGLGFWVLRHQGLRALRSVREAAASGHPVDRRFADGALIVLAGILLIIPGFVSDLFALLLLLPPTRALVRRALAVVGARHVMVVRSTSSPHRPGAAHGQGQPPVAGGGVRGSAASEDIIEGEVL